jgi:dihydroorotase
MKIEIKNGRVIDPGSGLDKPASVFIAASKIVGVGETAPRGFSAEAVLDATGCVVCPGLIDLSARLREPGFEYKATLESEMAAAAAGGITRLVCPPDTDPPLDEPGLVEMLKYRARQPGFAQVHPVGGGGGPAGGGSARGRPRGAGWGAPCWYTARHDRSLYTGIAGCPVGPPRYRA